jgi:hypothetical protein
MPRTDRGAPGEAERAKSDFNRKSTCAGDRNSYDYPARRCRSMCRACRSTRQSMIPKSVKRFSEKIMLKQKDKARRAMRTNTIAL